MQFQADCRYFINGATSIAPTSAFSIYVNGPLYKLLSGFDWYDFTDQGLEKHNLNTFSEGLTESDLSWAIYPSDKEIFESNAIKFHSFIFKYSENPPLQREP